MFFIALNTLIIEFCYLQFWDKSLGKKSIHQNLSPYKNIIFFLSLNYI